MMAMDVVSRHMWTQDENDVSTTIDNDAQVLVMNNERISVPELLFSPSDIGAITTPTTTIAITITITITIAITITITIQVFDRLVWQSW